jgi:hypothetical protein
MKISVHTHAHSVRLGGLVSHLSKPSMSVLRLLMLLPTSSLLGGPNQSRKRSSAHSTTPWGVVHTYSSNSSSKVASAHSTPLGDLHSYSGSDCRKNTWHQHAGNGSSSALPASTLHATAASKHIFCLQNCLS